ncbi:MAG TPA: trehalase family glycosidase [Blastocatellia bacterium]|jgi:alpha,alpha-trehalase
MGRRRSIILTSLGLVACFAAAAFPQPVDRRAGNSELKAVRAYIKKGWRTLARSNASLAEAAVDPKLGPAENGRWPVYVSRKESIKYITESLRAQMKPEDLARIELRYLPTDPAELRHHGLLYLPYPYVVPGGRFNEMYGWDSYFIQVGLLRDGELEMARNMVDNFVYQVEQYGKILNANRTYYLTRSQPPFLTRMILGVYRMTDDRIWLSKCVPAMEKYYRYWCDPLHFTRETRLSRYFDTGEGPAPEVVSSERDESGRTHYDRVREYYRTHDVKDYDLAQFYNRQEDRLTALFYIGDRSMRESGFDPSNRFGPFNVDIVHYNPVCLNSLLYIYESDMAEIMRTLAHQSEAARWQERAELRKRRINELMWDERDGLYYDYNIYKREVRRYPFVTTFYPLWAGIADAKQAARVVENLRLFERPGGLVTSTNESGSQWDSPFGWAPMQMIAVEGLRRYGYKEEADRVSANFLSMVLKEFIEHAGILEKYDVVRRESLVGNKIKFGYSSNEIGFGWTNAAFIEMYHQMSNRAKKEIVTGDK